MRRKHLRTGMLAVLLGLTVTAQPLLCFSRQADEAPGAAEWAILTETERLSLEAGESAGGDAAGLSDEDAMRSPADEESLTRDKASDAPGNGVENSGWIPEYSRTAPEGTLVILLDPGHDATHAGAMGHGLHEENLTLKIAQYCKLALEEYANVEVYLTRETAVCPYSGMGNGDDLYLRAMQARTVGADVFVSFHLNAGYQSTGASVYIQNKSWKPQLNAQGKALGESILAELSGLGLRNRGTWTDNAERQRYPDGSIADSLTVLRNTKRIDVPAVLIEHCYLSYLPDVQRYLSTEAQLQALGEADARGIAEHYGLTFADDTENFLSDAAQAVPEGLRPMYRIYMPRTHEHLYTADTNEVQVLLGGRWRYEGIAWYAPAKSETPVYRLFNRVSGEHLYTADGNERNVLLGLGDWNDEGIGWYSDDVKGMPVYRMFYAGLPAIASHHYTADANEYRVLTTECGWNDEAVGWYGAVPEQ